MTGPVKYPPNVVLSFGIAGLISGAGLAACFYVFLSTFHARIAVASFLMFLTVIQFVNVAAQLRRYRRNQALGDSLHAQREGDQ